MKTSTLLALMAAVYGILAAKLLFGIATNQIDLGFLVLLFVGQKLFSRVSDHLDFICEIYKREKKG